MNCYFYQEGIKEILCRVGDLLNYVVPVLIALGVVYFVWGVVQYVVGGGEEAKTKGKNTMIFGIIGLAVIIGLWGLVYIVLNTVGIDERDSYAPSSDDLRRLLPQ